VLNHVVATASAPFDVDILMIHRRFILSSDFHLRADTRRQTVTESRFDAGSFSIVQVAQ